MTLPIDPHDGSDLDTGGDERGAEGERRRIQRERLRDEVRRLEQAEQFVAALQAIRGSGLVSADAASLQPDIARLRQAARLQASYQRAKAALQAGDGEAAALLSAVVAVDPRYKDAARLLHETVSGASLQSLEAEVVASREAASRAEAERDRLVRGRARLSWVAGAQGVVLCLLLGWSSWRRPPSPAVDRRGPPAPSSEAQIARPPPPSAPEPLSPVAAPRGASPAPATSASAAGSPAPGAPPEDVPPPGLDGPCRRVGESCWSSAQCCFGSMCSGTTCQDTRRTIVFGHYRP